MLKGIPAIIPPELLKLLDEMGHGDEFTIGDANFPGHTCADKVIRMDGHSATDVLDAILQLLPLDQYTERPVMLMEVMPGDTVETPIWDEYRAIVKKYDDRDDPIECIERFAFYDRVKEKSRFVVMTGEKALYANVILKKGVL